MKKVDLARAVYEKNVDLIQAAAQSLGYTTYPLTIQGRSDLDTLGFIIRAHGKSCYISGKTFFPTVERWQAEYMKDKAITASLLDQYDYQQIPTLIFHRDSKHSDASMSRQLKTLPLPLVIKPHLGLDGKGIVTCTSIKAAKVQIKKLLQAAITVVVQPYIDAPEYRIFVTDQKIAFIHRKKYPEVAGDGAQTIEELIRTATYVDPDTVERQCQRYKYQLTSILPEGTSLQTHFTKKTDPDFIETESFGTVLPRYIARLCKDLSLDTVGLDVFFSGSIKKPGEITIIELNSNPGLRYLSNYYPDSTIAFTTTQTILKNYFTRGTKR